MKKTILNFGFILLGIIKTIINEINNKMFSIIFVLRSLMIKSLFTIFSIRWACVSTPGITLPLGILTKSNKPCAELPINTILFFNLSSLILPSMTSTAGI